MDGRSTLGDGKADSLSMPVRRSLDNSPADVEMAKRLGQKVNASWVDLSLRSLLQIQHDGNPSVQ